MIHPHHASSIPDSVPHGRKAVFLDRDGTLNKEISYLYRPQDWCWLPGVITGLSHLHAAGYLLVVITNQSGIARGFYTEQDLQHLHIWVNNQLASYGIAIDGFYFCPHHPAITGDCPCRKPSPYLIQKAAADMFIDLSQSWMIGDKALDYQAGIAAGCNSVLVTTGYGNSERTKLPEHACIARNFTEAVNQILSS